MARSATFWHRLEVMEAKPAFGFCGQSEQLILLCAKPEIRNETRFWGNFRILTQS
jgi:hypothetical protein